MRDDMTRINCIPPKELVDKHLIAEYRELPRVFALARPCNSAPDEYVLGAGHVKFFYNKLKYLYLRQLDLIEEMHSRGFKANFPAEGLIEKYKDKIEEHPELYRDWSPTKEAMSINRERISNRLGGK
jgi:hypothetical protein